MAKTNSKYTFVTFGKEAIALASGNVPENFNAERFITKAQAIITQNEKKAEYNATKEKISKVSPETLQKAEQIKAVLRTDIAITAEEINAKLNTDYSGMAIAGAAKYIPNIVITTVKVPKTEYTKTGKTKQVEKEYNGYKLADVG